MKRAVIKILLLFASFEIIQGVNKLKQFYEWSTDFEAYHEQIIPWNGTLLRIQNCKWGTNHAWYCFRTIDPYYRHHVSCDVKTIKKSPNFEIFFVTAVSLDNGHVVMKLNNLKFVIVDLASCSEILLNFRAPIISHQIIPRDEDTFDLNEGRALATYSDQGEFLRRVVKPTTWYDQVDRFLKPYGSNRIHYSIERLKAKCDLDEECQHTKMRILNAKYDVMEERTLEHPVDTFSYDHDMFTFCFLKEDPIKHVRDILEQPSINTVECSMRDVHFKIVKDSVVVGMTSETLMNHDIAVQNLVGGGAVVLYNGSEGKEEGVIIYRVIDKNGKPTEKGVFMRTKGSGANDFEIFLFEKDTEERIYCGVMARSDVVFGKCFKVFE